MSTDIGGIQGVIALRDDFTSRLGLAKAMLSQFSKENQESLKAIAEAGGLVVGVFTAIAGAALALGNRGADVNDAAASLDHFAGSARNANDIMEALRAGTLHTIEDFDLAKESTKLLSANVRLTAEDFGTLGAAAFVLQNRGLGSTKEMLGLVSEALVTGRTRSLSMALGVIEAGNAEEDYARKIGTSKDLLSEAGKAEAHRIEIMNMLRAAVKDAGAQERDFGEQLEFAKTAAMNLLDQTASMVANSPVLAAGMREVFAAVQAAFGNDQTTAAEALVHVIEQAAIIAVDFGLAGVEAARVFNVAWSLIKTTILGVESGLMAVATAVAVTDARILETAAALPGASQGLKDMATGARTTAEEMKAMTASLAAQSLEASKGMFGNSEFDKTLDELGGTLYRVRDAMQGATAATREQTEAEKEAATVASIHAKNAKILADAGRKWQIDKAAADKAALQDAKALSTIEAEHAKVRVEMSGTARDAAISDINQWKAQTIAAYKATGGESKAFYDEVEKTAHDKIKAVGIDWQWLQQNSREGLRQTAEDARATYNEMASGVRTFTRDQLQEQIDKVRELEDAARGMGKAFVQAEKDKAAASAARKKQLEEETEKVRALAKANRELGGQMEVTAANFDQFTTPGDISKTGLLALLRQGFSIANAIDVMRAAARGNAVNLKAWPEEARGPRVPGFAGGVQGFGGGLAVVGERGPEVVQLPAGANVVPYGKGGGLAQTNIFHVHGTDEASVRRMGDILMRQLKQSRMLPTT